MNELIKNLIYSLVLGAVWAVITKSFLSIDILSSGFISALFYPMLFCGFLFISSFYFDLETGLFRLFLTGLAAGLGYYLMSGFFPLLSIILLVLILALGFTAKSRGKTDSIAVLIKGIVILPLGIFISDALIMFFRAFTNAETVSWIILGSVLNLSFMLTIIPFSRLLTSSDNTDNNYEIKHEIDEFRSQATDIIKDLDSIHLN